MDTVDVSSPPQVRLQNDRFSEAYMHEFGELSELKEAPFGSMICQVEPGQATDEDFHNQSELFVVVTGTGSLIADNETVNINTGDVFTLQRKVPHVIKNTADTPLIFVSVWWPRNEPES
jgi:mannose-6-phosphate isomerase-like protein (cupin superfamily)